MLIWVISDFTKARWACEHPGGSSSLSTADRLRAEGKANKRVSCNTLDQRPEWFSKPTTLKNHFVFPIRTPALITYRPNRQINELKATLFGKGTERGKGRGGKQLTCCADSGKGFQAGCDKWKQLPAPMHHGGH